MARQPITVERSFVGIFVLNIRTSVTQGTRYALVTAAYNEERYIDKLILSIVSQSLPPCRWIIVSDGSTDRTEEIVLSYVDRYPYINLHRITEPHARDFSAQANAINCGFSLLAATDADFVGNLDADITLESTYFERLIAHFQADAQLGIGGGILCEEHGGTFTPRKTNNSRSVPHAIQMFRRSCLDHIGGYLSLPYGGSDWHKEVAARMNGWGVSTFDDLKAFHHRPTGTADNLIRYMYRQGKMDYSLGCHPIFELVKLATRLHINPPIIGSIARCAGFVVAHCRSAKRAVSADFVEYLRREQMSRLSSGILSRITPARERSTSTTSSAAFRNHK